MQRANWLNCLYCLMSPNVVLLVIDSLRADRLGCYGYHKNTSPHLDALACESVVFERAFAPGIPTMPSFTTLMTGLHPYRHGITAHSGENRLDENVMMMAQQARLGGYVTIGIDNLSVQGNGSGSWFARGFDFYSGFLYKPFSDQSEQLTNRALSYMHEYSDKPFFLFLHLWDPHTPYGPPSPCDTMHYTPGGEEGKRKLEEVTALAPSYYNAFLGDMKLRHPDDYNWVDAQYDGEISYVDAQVGRVVAQLKERGLWNHTIFIVQSDHGECFGEGKVYFDHHGLYDAVMRVALLWRTPDKQAARCASLVSTEDILPTLSQSCNWPLPSYELTGQSFGAALEGGTIEGRDFLVGVESTRQASLCWRTSKWKLILPLVEDKNGNAIVDIYGNARRNEAQLFDLKNDGGEATDVGGKFPNVRDDLLRQLNEWRAREVRLRGGDDPALNGLSLPFDDFMQRLTSRGLRG